MIKNVQELKVFCVIPYFHCALYYVDENVYDRTQKC